MRFSKQASKLCFGLLISGMSLSAGVQAGVDQNAQQQVVAEAQGAQEVSPQEKLVKKRILQRIFFTNLAAMKVGRVILERAESDLVREYGKALIVDHLQVLEGLHNAAQKAGISLADRIPDELADRIETRGEEIVKELKEAAKDRLKQAVWSRMTDTHTRSLEVLQEALQEFQDRDSQRRAEVIEFVVRKHLRMAEQLAD